MTEAKIAGRCFVVSGGEAPGFLEAVAQGVCEAVDGLPCLSFATIYAWIYAKARAAERLWLLLPRRRSRRRLLKLRRSKDRTADKTHISERPGAAIQRIEAGHWESDLVIRGKSRSAPVLHERKTRITFLARLSGKSAAQTVSALMAIVKRLSPSMRSSITLDNGGESRQTRHVARPALGHNVFSRRLRLVAKELRQKHERAIVKIHPPRRRP